jgi:hypothetical protein
MAFIGGRNLSHKNSFLKKEEPTVEVESAIEVAPVVTPELEVEAPDYYLLTKAEQVALLKQLGVKASQIRALRTEDSRVQKILELQR